MVTIKKHDLPSDWKAQHGQAVEDELFRRSVALFARRHESTMCRSIKCPFTSVEFVKKGYSLKSLSLYCALRLYNRTAFCYAFSPYNEVEVQKGWPFRFSVRSDLWLGEAWNQWAANCPTKEVYDGRFPLATLNLEGADDKRFGRWMSIRPDETPVDHEEDVSSLIDRHLSLCDIVEARSRTPLTAREADDVKPDPLRKGGKHEAEHIYHRHSALFPTCRAVIAIVPKDMTENKTLWLVLTGHHKGMKSGPPTFAGIHNSDVISRPSKNIVEVRLEAAIDYLQGLMAKEEAVNDELAKRNHERYEAMIEYLHEEGHQFVKDSLEKFDEGEYRCSSQTMLSFAMRKVMGKELQTLVTDEALLTWLWTPPSTRPYETLPAR